MEEEQCPPGSRANEQEDYPVLFDLNYSDYFGIHYRNLKIPTESLPQF